MNQDKFVVSGQAIELSEYKTYIELTNRLCYYGEPNKNKTVLPVDTAEEKAKTLIDMPVVAKYKVINGKPDIGGHEMVKLPDGTVKFGTENIGTHVAVEVKEDTVEVNGEEKTLPCLFAKSKIWTRNSNVVSAIKRLFDEGRLFSSWEIATLESETKDGIKYLKDYMFEANCLLGTGKSPAYGNCATTINVAEFEESPEMIIAEALSKDMEMEEEMDNQKNTSETSVEPTVAELTVSDIYDRIEKRLSENKISGYVSFLFPAESYALVHKWSMDELEFLKVPYFVDGNDLTIGEAEQVRLVTSVANINNEIAAKNAEIDSKDEEISKKNDALIEAVCKNKKLKAEIDELSEYKTKYEEMQSAQKAAELAEKQEELKNYAIKSGYITADEFETSEEIKKLISEVDNQGIKSLIVDRLMASKDEISTDSSSKIETSETKANQQTIITSSLIDPEEEDKEAMIADPKTIISQYIRG